MSDDRWECSYCDATGRRSEGEQFTDHFAEHHDWADIVAPFLPDASAERLREATNDA